MHHARVVAIFALVAVCHPLLVLPALGTSTAESPAAVTVNDQPIRASEIDSALETVLGSRQVPDDRRQELQAQLLEKLIDRRLVQAIITDGKPVDPKEITAAMAKLKEQFQKEKDGNADAFLARRGLNRTSLRDQLTWQTAWTKYLNQHLTDELLRKYFSEHQAEFDGSEIRVSHVLLRPQIAGDPQATEKLVKQANQVRDEILSGRISFADAAEKYSEGPSRHRGGDLGFVSRHGAMVEEFVRAAFALKKDEISPPVITPYGVHLITVTEVKPGSKSWNSGDPDLKEGAAQSLFDQLAHAARSKADIRYTGILPHYKPGTKEIVPARPAKESTQP